MERINPQLARERGNIEQRLADQGIRYGSQAYASAMDDYNRQATDTRFGAIGQAGQEQQRMMDMAAQRAGFQNAAQQQQYDQADGARQFRQSGDRRSRIAAERCAGRFWQCRAGAAAGAGAERFQRAERRPQSIHAGTVRAAQSADQRDYLVDVGGLQVQSPNWLNQPGSQIATTDVGGLINQNFAAAACRTTRKPTRTGRAQWAGCSVSAASSAAHAIMSDERTKQNIDRIGTVFAYNEDAERKKLPIYEWEYKHDPGKRRVGPMAQDVEKIDRGAVSEIGGVKHINPSRVMGNILRAA